MKLEGRSEAGGAPIVGIVLVAGLGRRLGPLTDARPKCLVPVCGRPILDSTLQALRRNGVRHVVLVVGYLAETVRRFAMEHWRDGEISFVTNERYASTGTAFSLSLGLSAVGPNRPVLVLEGDVVFEPELLGDFLGAPRGTATVVAPYRPELTGTFVTVGRGGVITDWVHERVRAPGFPLAESFKTVNISSFSAEDVARGLKPALARCLEQDGPGAPLEFAMRRAIRELKLEIVAVDPRGRRWFEVDTPEDLQIAESLFAGAFPTAGATVGPPDAGGHRGRRAS